MPKIIALISQKGGVGKSTIARACAVEATRSKKKLKVLLADCDFQQTTSHGWAQWRKENKIKPEIHSEVFTKIADLWKVANNYDVIIIDAPARTSQATKEIAEKADLVVQPVGASRDDLVPALREFNALNKKAGIPSQQLLFVINHLATQAEANATQKFLTKTVYPYLPVFLYEKASYRQAQNEGKAITEVSYPKLKTEAKRLAIYTLQKGGVKIYQ